MKIQYYRMRFRLVSPLSVGSGDNEHTDSDVILDSRNRPVIPATAIAGVIRHECETGRGKLPSLFGSIESKTAESKIRFYDAVSETDSMITIRDMVALEQKVGIDGAKFDREAVETNADFVTLFELRGVSEDETNYFLNALSALNAGHLRFGSKTSRGYGQISITELKKAEFDLPANKEDWLKFESYDYTADAFYSPFTLPEYESRFMTIHLELKQKGAISIRSYTARNGKDIDEADYEQLTMSNGVPVIPGTSWAGAFRDRFREFAGEAKPNDTFTKQIFGFVDVRKNDDPKTDSDHSQQKSRVYFSESRIAGFERKIITRNSIDRFSAATKDGALYTENTVYDGTCQMEIMLQKDAEDFGRAKKLLIAVIRDLHNGYLAVGGLTAIGRGLFTVTCMTVDSEDMTELIVKGGQSE